MNGGQITPETFGEGSAFVKAMGLTLVDIAGDRVTGFLDLGPDHHTPWGVVHGGVYTSVAESVASIGASAAVMDKGMFAVGVHNGTDFLRSMTTGRLDVVGVPIQQGRVQQLWLVTMTRADGKEVARGQVRLQNVPLPSQA
jgi:1,4-dihydroxy-2-naphthoyl-CoA hydrolase